MSPDDISRAVHEEYERLVDERTDLCWEMMNDPNFKRPDLQVHNPNVRGLERTGDDGQVRGLLNVEMTVVINWETYVKLALKKYQGSVA